MPKNFGKLHSASGYITAFTNKTYVPYKWNRATIPGHLNNFTTELRGGSEILKSYLLLHDFLTGIGNLRIKLPNFIVSETDYWMEAVVKYCANLTLFLDFQSFPSAIHYKGPCCECSEIHKLCANMRLFPKKGFWKCVEQAVWKHFRHKLEPALEVTLHKILYIYTLTSLTKLFCKYVSKRERHY